MVRPWAQGAVGVLAALVLAVLALIEFAKSDYPVSPDALLDPAAEAQQLAQISEAQQNVLREQAKMQQLTNPAFHSPLAGWAPPGGTPSAPQTPYNPSPNRLAGHEQPGMGRTSGSESGQTSGPARLHGYSTGMVADGGASPWSWGPGYNSGGQPSLGGGWKPDASTQYGARHEVHAKSKQYDATTYPARAPNKQARIEEADFETRKGRDERQRITKRVIQQLQLLQKLKKSEKTQAKRESRAAQNELRSVIGARAVENVKIVITKAKPVKVKPLEFSSGTKALFANLQAAAAFAAPLPATYSNPFGGATAQPLPAQMGAFYRDGGHPDDNMAALLHNQLAGVQHAQDRFHYADAVYHFTPQW